jgi:acyl dehydratase
MHVSSRLVFQQGPMLATLGKTAARALLQRVQTAKPTTILTPSPTLTRTFAPIDPRLISAYVTYLGGDPRAYRGVVPPHLFPHWALPVAAETLRGIPYPILRVLNAGCRMQVNAPLPRDQALHVSASLASIDDDGKRAILTQRVVTGTERVPDALICEIYAFVPLPRKPDATDAERRPGNGGPASDRSAKPAGRERERPRVPQGAREIAVIELDRDAGLSFAKLTGDFNPIHWLAPYAKASGFRSVILHGFGTFAHCCEALNRGLFGGDVGKLKLLDAKFTRPLVLPHRVGVYVRKREVFIGDAVEGPAYMTGRFDTGEES